MSIKQKRQQQQQQQQRKLSISKRKKIGTITFLIIILGVSFCITNVFAQDDYDYVKEVLEDDFQHYGGGYNDDEDNEYMYQQQQQQQQRQAQFEAQQQEAERIEAERIREEREAKFEAELAKMNQEQQKSAKRQKKKDAKICSIVLKHTSNENYYAVLGIRNWNLQIPSRTISIPFMKQFNITIPGVNIKTTTSKDIKKAYRVRALQVHPDRNRDGKAQEAFVAVENASSILCDTNLRAEYDAEMAALRKERQEKTKKVIMDTIEIMKRVMTKFVVVFKKVFGPFAVPVAVLGFLIF